MFLSEYVCTKCVGLQKCDNKTTFLCLLCSRSSKCIIWGVAMDSHLYLSMTKNFNKKENIENDKEKEPEVYVMSNKTENEQTEQTESKFLKSNYYFCKL